MGVCDSRWFKMKYNSGATRFPSCFYSIFTSLLTKGRRPRIREKKENASSLSLSLSLFCVCSCAPRKDVWDKTEGNRSPSSLVFFPFFRLLTIHQLIFFIIWRTNIYPMCDHMSMTRLFIYICDAIQDQLFVTSIILLNFLFLLY
jgi:hypothetical protein